MKDPEFIQLVKKVIFAVVIVLLFIIPIFFVIKNKFSDGNHNILNNIRNEKNMVLLITSEDCSNCKEIRKVLKNKNIKYTVLNKDTNRDYDEIIIKLETNKSGIKVPTLMNIEKGKLISYIVDIDEEDLNNFIDSYELSK